MFLCVQSNVDPFNMDVQAGLGTSLLVQGVFHDEKSKSNLKDEEGARVSLLTLATFHLKVASSLCASSRGINADIVSDGTVVHAKPLDNDVLSRLTSSTRIEAEGGNAESRLPNKDLPLVQSPMFSSNAASNAAILHNLALAYLALGDTNSSIPLLLRAAALRREYPIVTNLHWNVPEEVLQVVEEKALLIGAKTKKEKRTNRRRIPFVPDDFTADDLMLI